MRKTTRKTLMAILLGLLVLALAAPAFAENQGGTFTLDPFTGFYVFDKTQQMDARSYNGLRAGYNLTPRLGVEVMFGYILTETNSMAFRDRDVNVYRYGLDALYHFNPGGTVVPFIEAGIGATQTDNPSGMKDHAHGLLDYGLGLKWFLADTVALRGDIKQARYTEGGSSRDNMEYTIGLTFLLGAEKRAVAVVPVADTTAPVVVCTSPDNGVTGVSVNRNITATFSEEMAHSTITTSTFTVKNGTTPVPGRVGYSGLTATFNPSNDLEKGATYTATIVAGVKDLAGNAMANSYVWSFTTIPPPKIAAPVVLIVLEDNHFDFDKSTITKQGEDILDENIRVLKANPKVKVRIAGYTSAKGTDEYNQKLSERRAESVKDYLVKGGIASDRLVTIGYGRTRPAEYEPLPDNIYSKEAKANMRVLFEVIVK